MSTSGRDGDLAGLAVNVVGWSNRGGLRRDAEIVEGLLLDAGACVTASSWYLDGRNRAVRKLQTVIRRRWRRRFDVCIYLERAPAHLLRQGRRTWLIPNPEWLEPERGVLSRVDLILAKSRHAVATLADLGRPVVYTGFTSVDRLDPSVTRSDGVLHIAGRSWQKGTGAVLSAWERHPEWPLLTVLHRPQEHRGAPFAVHAPNIRYVSDHLADEEVRRLQNECAVHLCPSEAEGFGHTINEGLSVGAVVVTTDAPPMNELVQEDRGLLVPWERSEPMAHGTRYFVTPEALEAAVSSVLGMSVEERMSVARRARTSFEQTRREFADRLLALALDQRGG